jgi:hypothetical protein
MRFYVYELRDPKTLIPFYVGKGNGNRMWAHESKVRRGKVPNHNTHLYNKIKKILDEGEKPIPLKIFETDEEPLAFEKEREIIRTYREAGFKLCNLCDGGEGVSGNHWELSAEARQHISQGLKGVPKSEEHKEAMRQSRLLHPPSGWKRDFTPEQLSKMSEAAKNRMKKDKGHYDLCVSNLKKASKERNTASKGRTLEEIYGNERGLELREIATENIRKGQKKEAEQRKGKSYEEIFGVEKAQEHREKLKEAWARRKKKQEESANEGSGKVTGDGSGATSDELF